MANIYVALNGDDVGSKIGEAIASDDHEGLASASSAIESAHGNIDQWVESIGGKKITRSGDEGIYLIPEESLSDLESIKGSYKEQSGHGLTIGVGNSMSEASKALIYGKLNGKDQVVHYEPSIEDYLSDQDISDDEMPEEVSAESDEDQDQAASSEEVESDDEESEEEDDDDQEEAEEESEEETPELSDDNQILSESPTSKKPPVVSEEPEESGEDDQEGSEDLLQEDSQDPDAPGSKAIDGDIDGEDLGSDKDNSEQEDQDQEMENNQAPMAAAPQSAAPAPEMDQEPAALAQEQSAYKDLNNEDLANPDMDLGNEQYNQNDALTDMIHGDLENDQEGSAPEEMSAEGMGDSQGDSQLDEELRQDIASALMAFKENKDMLEQAREQNPKLYQATITMLRSMIEMAKKLGQNPEQDIQDQESEQELNEEFPAADEEEGQDLENQDQEMPMDMPPKGMPAEKK